ncbi:hypothetical protein [Peptacetobacter sp. AB800]|uniref:hypothetical protein n=1 Tax=Peptacetobacter sp. AB800 TaxID=3388428 RepID=UPI0039FC2F41
MTKYSDFDIKIKKTSGENKETRTITPIITYTIKECENTAGSGCTGCCNSKRNCPGSTGRRK